MSGRVELRDIPDFPGYRIGSDRSVWSSRHGGEWRRRKVQEQVTRGRPGGPRVSLRYQGRNCTVTVDELMRMAFPSESTADDAPAGLPSGTEFRPVPGFPGYGVGSDRSAWSRRSLGPPTLRARRPEAMPWRRLDVAGDDGHGPRIQMTRDGRRYWVSLDAAMHAAFGTPAD